MVYDSDISHFRSMSTTVSSVKPIRTLMSGSMFYGLPFFRVFPRAWVVVFLNPVMQKESFRTEMQPTNQITSSYYMHYGVQNVES